MATTATEAITETARAFFDACETGKGWAGCSSYCHPAATFAAQAEPIVDVHTLEEYAEWMKGMLVILPDGAYVVKSFATDHERGNVCAYGVFSGTHTGEGGPMPPTGKRASADYVYVMEFDDGKIRHMTKIWNAGLTMRELGWAA
jgi:predicted ester cyclase